MSNTANEIDFNQHFKFVQALNLEILEVALESLLFGPDSYHMHCFCIILLNSLETEGGILKAHMHLLPFSIIKT